MKKSIKSLLTGFKKGLITPTLPDNINKIISNPIIRIFRFLGGVSFLFVLSKGYLILNSYSIYTLYVAMFFASLFTIYHIVLSYYRTKHIIFLIKSGKMDIRNSPLDRLATLSAKALLCFKGACDQAQPIGLTLGLMLGTDEILKSVNREPIFAPFLGSILNTVLPENVRKDSVSLIDSEIDKLKQNNQELKNNILLDKFKALNLKGDLTVEEFNEFKKLIGENKQSLIEDNDKIKSKMLDMIKAKDQSGNG